MVTGEDNIILLYCSIKIDVILIILRVNHIDILLDFNSRNVIYNNDTQLKIQFAMENSEYTLHWTHHAEDSNCRHLNGCQVYLIISL